MYLMNLFFVSELHQVYKLKPFFFFWLMDLFSQSQHDAGQGDYHKLVPRLFTLSSTPLVTIPVRSLLDKN